VGSLLGTLIGVLPGIGPTSGIAILLPLTTVLDPIPAIIMMAAIYYGGMYGGSTTAIVVNIPGESASVPTCPDGYELAKTRAGGPSARNRRHLVLRGRHIESVRADLLRARAGQRGAGLRPPEYFALMFMGLSLVISRVPSAPS